jgi:hypothetical protein
VIVNPGGQSVPAGVVTEPKSSKRGVLVLASIAVLASLAAVVALVTSGSGPQSQAADELPAVEAGPIDSSTVDATNPSETLVEELEPQEAVTVESGPPLTEPVIEVSGVSARPATPATQAPAPTITQPPVPGAIDGAPSAYGYRYDSNDSYSTTSEKFTIYYSLNDPDGVSKSTIQVRRSNNQIVSRCRNSSQLISGTRFGGEWRAECIIDDQQPSTAYSRTYTVEHCSLDSFGNEACARIGSMYFSLTNVITTSSTSTSTTRPPSGSDTSGPSLSGFSFPASVNAGSSLTVSVDAVDPSGIGSVSFCARFGGRCTAWLYHGTSSPISGNRYSVTVEVPSTANSGRYELWVYAEDRLGNSVEAGSRYFEVLGGGSDTSGPSLSGFSFPASVNAGSSLTVSVDAVDPSGIGSVSFCARFGGRCTAWLYHGTSSPISGNRYSVTVEVPSTANSGRYELWVYAEDRLGNSVEAGSRYFEVM